MASSQNEQDNRRYAVAAGVPMLEPADSQEAYEMLLEAMEISGRWHQPVMLRMTTRVCHSKTLVRRREKLPQAPVADFVRDIQGRVMIPAYARMAHKKLRQKLADMQRWNERSLLTVRIDGDKSLGIITSGICYVHAREAAPQASMLKLGMTYPLPMETIRNFAKSVKRCVVIEEGDPYLADAIRAAGIAVESKDEMYRFGELNVARVRRILANDTSPEPAPAKGKPPQLCPGCPYRTVFETLRKLDCIVAGDIGCYTLGVLPPFQGMDTCVCMGASLGVGLGMRHVLPEEQAKRVVSIIGDSTFVHTGINGLVEMIYNPPKTGHVLIILDNGTTAMTGQQEHPGTGRTLMHEPTGKFTLETFAKSLGIQQVHVTDPTSNPEGFETLLRERLAANELAVIIARRPCLLAAAKIRQYEQAAAAKCEACDGNCSH